MFADTILALRIESAEARLTNDSVLGIQRGGKEDGAFVRKIGGGTAAFFRPGSPMNKVIGAGIGEPLDETPLTEIEQLYRERNEPVRFEISTLALTEVGYQLTKRGYRLLGFENVLGKVVKREASPEGGSVRVEHVADARAGEWARVLVAGFGHSDETGIVVDTFSLEVINQAVNDSLCVSGFDRYLAVREGIPAGAASMRLDAGIALLTGAATLHEHRMHGVQSTLLAQRLLDAHVREAEVAVITTAGGTRSQANAIRHGFSLLYSRAILVLGDY